MKGPWSTWGLRGTVTASFALGALIVSALFAVGTYLTARHYLMEQRQATALRQAYADASFVLDGPRATPASPRCSATSTPRPTPSSSSVPPTAVAPRARGPQAIPIEVRDGVVDGAVTYGWSSVAEQPALVVGIPLPAADAEFYEIVSTTELRSTLATLATVLAAFAVLATLAGAALGRLPAADGAARRRRHGRRPDRRRWAADPASPTDDPDLATIVGSFNSMVEARREDPARRPVRRRPGSRAALAAHRARRQCPGDGTAPRRPAAAHPARSTSSLSSWTGSSRPWRTSSSSVGSTPASAARSSPRSTRPSWSGSRSSRAVTTPR